MKNFYGKGILKFIAGFMASSMLMGLCACGENPADNGTVADQNDIDDSALQADIADDISTDKLDFAKKFEENKSSYFEKYCDIKKSDTLDSLDRGNILTEDSEEDLDNQDELSNDTEDTFRHSITAAKHPVEEAKKEMYRILAESYDINQFTTNDGSDNYIVGISDLVEKGANVSHVAVPLDTLSKFEKEFFGNNSFTENAENNKGTCKSQIFGNESLYKHMLCKLAVSNAVTKTKIEMENDTDWFVVKSWELFKSMFASLSHSLEINIMNTYSDQILKISNSGLSDNLKSAMLYALDAMMKNTEENVSADTMAHLKTVDVDINFANGNSDIVHLCASQLHTNHTDYGLVSIMKDNQGNIIDCVITPINIGTLEVGKL